MEAFLSLMVGVLILVLVAGIWATLEDWGKRGW